MYLSQRGLYGFVHVFREGKCVLFRNKRHSYVKIGCIFVYEYGHYLAVKGEEARSCSLLVRVHFLKII